MGLARAFVGRLWSRLGDGNSLAGRDLCGFPVVAGVELYIIPPTMENGDDIGEYRDPRDAACKMAVWRCSGRTPQGFRFGVELPAFRKD